MKPSCTVAPRAPALSSTSASPAPMRGLALSLALIFIAGCTATAPRAGTAAPPFASGDQVTIQGEVSSVDLSPMAYDGNAVVTVDSDAHGPMTVQFPARRNLCQAQGFDLLTELKAGDRIAVAGEVSGPDNIHVCQSASHRLQRLD